MRTRNCDLTEFHLENRIETDSKGHPEFNESYFLRSQTADGIKKSSSDIRVILDKQQ